MNFVSCTLSEFCHLCLTIPTYSTLTFYSFAWKHQCNKTNYTLFELFWNIFLKKILISRSFWVKIDFFIHISNLLHKGDSKKYTFEEINIWLTISYGWQPRYLIRNEGLEISTHTLLTRQTEGKLQVTYLRSECEWMTSQRKKCAKRIGHSQDI